MNASDLEEHEQLVLIGLVKLIVHADQHVSNEERAALRLLQMQVGEETWNQRVRQASEQFATIPALEQAALSVERPEAQHLIHKLLVDIAGSDEVIPEEAHVLQWIDQTWRLSEEDEEEEEEDEHEPAETFVLIDDDDG